MSQLLNTKSSALLAGALILVVGLTAGCGANPAGTKTAKKKAVATRPAALNAAAPGALPAAVGANPAIATLLAQLRKAQQMPGFTATIETFDKGPKGQEGTTMKVAYKKPATIRIEMTKASGQAQGAKILWSGSSDLKIKPTFLPFPTSMAISDAKVLSKNGWTIKDTDVNAIFRVVFDPSAQLAISGQEPSGGKTLTLLQVKSPLSPKPCDGEIIAVDSATGLPVERRMFKGMALIYKLTIKNMQLKTPSASELSV